MATETLYVSAWVNECEKVEPAVVEVAGKPPPETVQVNCPA